MHLNETFTDILIVGAGFGGLGMGMQLKRRGHDDFLIIERAGDVGGTWRDNHYPGAACDVPSHLYSFSFRLNPNWSQAFSPGHEIQQYLRDCAREEGLLEHLRFHTTMTDARWQKTRDFMVSAGLLAAATDWKQAYTTEFVQAMQVKP